MVSKVVIRLSVNRLPVSFSNYRFTDIFLYVMKFPAEVRTLDLRSEGLKVVSLTPVGLLSSGYY